MALEAYLCVEDGGSMLADIGTCYDGERPWQNDPSIGSKIQGPTGAASGSGMGQRAKPRVGE